MPWGWDVRGTRVLRAWGAIPVLAVLWEALDAGGKHHLHRVTQLAAKCVHCVRLSRVCACSRASSCSRRRRRQGGRSLPQRAGR